LFRKDDAQAWDRALEPLPAYPGVVHTSPDSHSTGQSHNQLKFPNNWRRVSGQNHASPPDPIRGSSPGRRGGNGGLEIAML